jgi:hypothetical protein
VSARDLDEEGDDDCRDDGHARKCRRVYVDLTEPLVASVPRQAADRLAAAAEKDERAECGQDSEREEPRARVAVRPT